MLGDAGERTGYNGEGRVLAVIRRRARKRGSTTDHDPANAADRAIRERRTTKVLADAPLPAQTDRATIEALAEIAGWAPFHKPAAREHLEGASGASIVPWRFHLLDAAACRTLREHLLARGDRSKIPRLLAAATALVQATWLPNPASGPVDGLFEATQANMEHVAAAGAAVQSLLVAATARGIPSYWSSGGALRSAEAFGWMGIPAGEILLGSIFLFPAEHGDAETSPGAHRERRGTAREWSRWIDLDVTRAASAP